MPLPGSMAENRLKLLVKAAAGDLHAQARIRTGDAQRKRQQALRDQAAKAKQVADQDSTYSKEYYARQKAKREAGDPEAIAQYERKLRRKAERKQELNAGDEAPGSDNDLRQHRAQQQPVTTVGPIRSTQGTEQQYIEEEDEDVIPSLRRGLHRGSSKAQQPMDATPGAVAHTNGGQGMGAPKLREVQLAESKRPLARDVEGIGAGPAKRQKEYEEPGADDPVIVIKRETQRPDVVDLTSDDEGPEPEEEVLALQLEIEERAKKAAEVKLKMLKLKRKR